MEKYAVMVDFVREHVDTGVVNEYTRTVWGTADKEPGKIAEEGRDRELELYPDCEIWFNDVYAP